MAKCNMLLGVIFISFFIEVVPENTAQVEAVEVRAVLISCEPEDGESVPFDNEAMRFEREELFKHSVLRDCHKKIALTVKITSDPDNSGDEYIPIEHVFQGPNKRIRLLNPYVLRLQRELPLQAYKLRKVDTVTGTLAEEMTTRIKSNSQTSDVLTAQNQLQHKPRESPGSESCEIALKRLIDVLCLSRSKRYENSIEDGSESYSTQTITKDSFASGLDVNDLMSDYDETSRVISLDDNMIESSANFKENMQPVEEAHLDNWQPIVNDIDIMKTTKPEPFEVQTKIDGPYLDDRNQINSAKYKGINKMVQDSRKDYDMYEIGDADLWYTIQVQLFEKMSTPEGKTVWNDLSKGKPARVSSLSPQWTGQDMSIRYRSSEWIPRAEFTLPVTSMCLLAPVGNKAFSKNNNNADQYIVVPREDVVGFPINGSGIKKRDDNLPKLEVSSKQNEQSLRQVLIRTTRALFGNVNDKVSIVPKGDDQFLTLKHRQPYHAQIDLEARADGNQLIHVGSFGRIMTVVADSSRKTRTILTVQVTNTGLAAARFRVVARECNPEIPEILSDKDEADDSFIVLPPKQTQSILLDVPTEIPVDVAHCSVVLLNGDDQSVAVRDVTIRKGDRCFCVWHCECVCLGEDPKLLCREMPDARQIAAGLSLRERTRHVRSVCYHDVVSLNICITAFGVLATLLFCGLVKACLGLMCRYVGTWGLPRILQVPRKLDHYYEASLQDRKVVYDDEGWPVHPDTNQRTVRLVSMSMEFILNTIFFVTAPCVIIYDALKQVFNRCKKSDGCGSNWNSSNTKNCFSSHDIQSPSTHLRRRRWRLQRWMTPEAEKLSSNVMQEGLPIRASMIRDCMRPLLHEEFNRGDGGAPVMVQESCGDSEVDDTEYVLMQMQKSRESLARSQRKLNGSVATTAKKQ